MHPSDDPDPDICEDCGENHIRCECDLLPTCAKCGEDVWACECEPAESAVVIDEKGDVLK